VRAPAQVFGNRRDSIMRILQRCQGAAPKLNCTDFGACEHKPTVPALTVINMCGLFVTAAVAYAFAAGVCVGERVMRQYWPMARTRKAHFSNTL
jgi:hypothetical protein